MKDLDGHSYGASPTAFAYRKSLVNGCACRPMPWSDSERARHEGYALQEAEKAIRLAAAVADAERLKTERLAAATNGREQADSRSTVAAADAALAPPAVTNASPDDPYPVGVREAAALAAGRSDLATDREARDGKRSLSLTDARARRKSVIAAAGRLGDDKPVRTKKARASNVRVAAAQVDVAPSWFGKPKFRYPGD